jgi:GR25 family glycosyltransferase involved in LPS biosynthesis
MAFRGFYINLDRKPERRRRMEAEFRRFRLAAFYERISAVDGHPGAVGPWGPVIGCFRSHLKVMEIGKGRGIVHVLEDDELLSGRIKLFLESRVCAAMLAEFDLLFLEMWVEAAAIPRYREALSRAGAGVHAMNLRGIRIGSASSYVVSDRSSARIASLLAEEVRSGPRMPVDSFYSSLVDTGLLKAAVVLPFLTCMDMETGPESSIQSLQRGEMVTQAMLRRAFFVDPNRQPAAPSLPAGPGVAARS